MSAARRKTPPLVLVLLAAAAAFAVCLCAAALASCSTAQSEGDRPAEGAPVINDAPAGSPLRLSSWPEFGKYWEQAREDDAAYIEPNEDGSSSFYRLKDGFARGDAAAENCVLLVGAQPVDPGASDSEWNLAVVDCSTGEATRWVLAPEVRERLERDGAVFDESEIAACGDKWVAYWNPPSYAEGEWIVRELMDCPAEEELREMDVIDFESCAESKKLRIAADALRDDELRGMLLERYGEDAVQEWLDKAVEQEDEE